ncbi:nucleotide sugar dehydrogenase [Streptomyces sp. SLBN-8D4]
MALKITVIGTGYLGATHAAAMAELGFEVLGLDVVPEKIEILQRGQVPMYEPGLEELLRKHVAGIEGSTGRLRFTMDWEEAGAFGDVHFVCVNTPQRHGEYACDMSYVDSAFASLAPHLTRPALVVGKSTVPVGSADRLARYLADHSPAGADAELAWNPEFLREGFAVDDTLHPDRIVVGVRSERAEKLLREVYATPLGEGTPFVVTDFPTAELVKTSANSFLAHEDLLHQRDGGGLRGRRRRCRQAGRGHRVRRPDREEVPAGRDRLRRRLSAQGHPCLHGPCG